jgi:hypothetical protein
MRERLEWILFTTLSLLLAAGFIALVVLASTEPAKTSSLVAQF